MMQVRIFGSTEELKSAVGEEIGPTDWQQVDQKQIDLFAEATGDHQWIHVDPEKAAGGPVRHHHRARLPDALPASRSFTPQLFTVEGVQDGRQLRREQGPFPLSRAGRLAPAGHGADRGGRPRWPAAIQLVTQITVEREDGDKPVCVAETVVRFYL